MILSRASLSIALLTVLTVALAACGAESTSTARKPTAPPEFKQRTLYVGVQDNNLYALDAQTGANRWTFETQNEVHSAPALTGDLVIFGSDDQYFYAVRSSDGTRVWRFKTEGTIGTQPVVASGVAFMGSDDGKLNAVEVATGAQLWQASFSRPVDSIAAIG
jgi:outer membrane protein assembly factor BamB